MKKLFITLMLSCLAVGAMAQGLKPISFGVKAGIISDNIDILKSGKDELKSIFSDPKTGWQLGLTSRINLAMFHIQPEILFNMNRYDLRTEMETGGVATADVKINTVDVPVLFGLRLLMLRLQAGPTFNLLTDTKVKNSAGAIHYVKADRPSVSYTLGLGLDLFGVNLDARYNGTFERMKQDIQVGDGNTTSYKTKFNSWMFSIGYMF